jgi:hypothetical protein
MPLVKPTYKNTAFYFLSSTRWVMNLFLINSVVIPFKETQFTGVGGYSLFAENGVVIRNLNYRPWQWVYSISGCKSFPVGGIYGN